MQIKERINFKIGKILFLFLFIVFSNHVLGQECEAIEYHRIIKEAKIDYNNKKYKEANKKIKASFSKNLIPFGEDLELALKVAIKTNDSEWAKEIAIVLAKGGVPNRFFFKLKEFSWYNEFEENFKNYEIYYQKKCDSSFVSQIVYLIEKDEKFNYKFHGWRLKKTEMSLEEMIKKSEEIYNSFYTLIDKYGFPSSENVGYNYIREKNRVEKYNVNILIRHIYQRGELIFLNKLDELYCNNSIDDITYKGLLEVASQFENNSPGVVAHINREYKRLKK